MNTYIINGYKRISKAAARKAYDNGETLRIVPCKVAPVNAWGIGFDERKAEGSAEYVGRFDSLVNGITWYNCNAETGYYLAYYIKAE